MEDLFIFITDKYGFKNQKCSENNDKCHLMKLLSGHYLTTLASVARFKARYNRHFNVIDLHIKNRRKLLKTLMTIPPLIIYHHLSCTQNHGGPAVYTSYLRAGTSTPWTRVQHWHVFLIIPKYINCWS